MQRQAAQHIVHKEFYFFFIKSENKIILKRGYTSIYFLCIFQNSSYLIFRERRLSPERSTSLHCPPAPYPDFTSQAALLALILHYALTPPLPYLSLQFWEGYFKKQVIQGLHSNAVIFNSTQTKHKLHYPSVIIHRLLYLKGFLWCLP